MIIPLKFGLISVLEGGRLAYWKDRKDVVSQEPDLLTERTFKSIKPSSCSSALLRDKNDRWFLAFEPLDKLKEITQQVCRFLEIELEDRHNIIDIIISPFNLVVYTQRKIAIIHYQDIDQITITVPSQRLFVVDSDINLLEFNNSHGLVRTDNQLFSITTILTSIPFNKISEIKQMVSGDGFNMLLLKDGSVWVNYILSSNHNEFTLFRELEDNVVIKIVQNYHNLLFITNDGKCFNTLVNELYGETLPRQNCSCKSFATTLLDMKSIRVSDIFILSNTIIIEDTNQRIYSMHYEKCNFQKHLTTFSKPRLLDQENIVSIKDARDPNDPMNYIYWTTSELKLFFASLS